MKLPHTVVGRRQRRILMIALTNFTYERLRLEMSSYRRITVLQELVTILNESRMLFYFDLEMRNKQEPFFIDLLLALSQPPLCALIGDRYYYIQFRLSIPSANVSISG